MRLDSLSRLKYFKDLAETGRFSQSAQRLGIAQPALSIAIKKLEEETGLKLINRGSRQKLLTSDGEVLLKHARRILEGLDDAVHELRERRGVETGEVNIGASSMLSTYYLPPYLMRFKRAYPGVRVRLVEGGTDTLEDWVINGDLDLALVRTDRPDDRIRYAAPLHDQVVACMPADHPLADRPAIDIETFCAHPSVLFRRGYYLRESIERRARDQGLDLSIQFETNLVELLKQLVRNGLGLATCLAMIVEDDPTLTCRPFDPPIPLDLAWGWKKNHYLSKAGQAFLACFDETRPAP